MTEASASVCLILATALAIKTERTQIHFLSDVLVAVASLDLKVPNIFPLRRRSQGLRSPSLVPKRNARSSKYTEINCFNGVHKH